jgi:hypothetical protein
MLNIMHNLLNLAIIYLVKDFVNATIFGSHRDSAVCRAPDGHKSQCKPRRLERRTRVRVKDAFLHSFCLSQRNSHPTGPLPRWWRGIADIGCEAGKCLVWVEPAQLQ